MYRLHTITGEFLDRRVERDFRASVLPEVQRTSRLTLNVAALLTILFLVSDYSFLGFAWPFYPPLVLLRAATIMILLGLAFYLFRSDALLDRAWVYSLAPLTVSTGVFIVAALRPQTLHTQVTAVGIVVMAIFLFAPNVMRGVLATSAYLSVGFLLSAWYFAEASAAVLLRIGILLVLANVVGYFAALRIARLQRQQFALLMEERRSKERLVIEVDRREALERRLRDLAETDGLTGLSNRRHFIETAEAARAAARARGEPFSLAMIDVDHFKRINDNFGHGLGDDMLKLVAETCVRVFGTGVPVGRLGGEEFAVALPGMPVAAATAAAERLRGEVSALRAKDGPPDLRVTVTIGIAGVRPEEPDLSAALARADAALYEGKRRGRNVVVADGA